MQEYQCRTGRPKFKESNLANCSVTDFGEKRKNGVCAPNARAVVTEFRQSEMTFFGCPNPGVFVECMLVGIAVSPAETGEPGTINLSCPLPIKLRCIGFPVAFQISDQVQNLIFF